MRALPTLLSFFLGALSSFAFAPFFYWWLFAFTLPGFYSLLAISHDKKTAFLRGYSFGYGFFLAGLYWIALAFRYEKDFYIEFLHIGPYLAIGLVMLLIPAAFAFFFGAVGFLFHLLTHNISSKILSPGRILLFITLWSGLESLRAILFTGFPWNNTAQIFADSLPLLQLLAYFGQDLLGFFILLWAFGPFLFFIGLISKKKHLSLIGLFLLLSFGGAYNIGKNRFDEREELSPSFTALLVQPAFSQTVKMNPEKRDAMIFDLLKMTANKPQADYIIWPETAILYDLTKAPILRKQIASFLPPKSKLISGMLRIDINQNHFFNSLAILNSKGEIEAIYDKKHLVPFGEYIPLANFFTFTPVAMPLGFSKGEGSAIINENAHPFLPLICYEVIFSNEILSHIKNKKVSWLLTISNDGWYGLSSGPYQHFYIARMRAVEFGLPLLRVSNSGISALIDPYGVISSYLKLGEKNTAFIEVPKPLETSFYRKFSTKITVFYTLFVILIFVSPFIWKKGFKE